MKRAKLILIILGIAILVLGVAQVAVSNSISTAGIQLEKLQTEITALEKSNEILHEQYLTLASYQHISSAAGQLGFAESTKVMSVTTPTSFAYKQ